VTRLRRQVATSLVERVTQEIKSSILSGALRPGQQISLPELCLELDVSHIPVREALRRLDGDGLVMLRPSKSAIITPLSLSELDEVYRLRLSIEADLAARSAPSYTSEQLDTADGLLEEMRSMGRGSRGLVGADAHARLHKVLLTPAAGPVSAGVLQRLWDVGERYTSLVYDVRPTSTDDVYRRHLDLVTIARTRNGSKIRKAIVEHLTESEQYMTECLTPLLSAAGEVAAIRSPRENGNLARDNGAKGTAGRESIGDV
jgi:DNA-binding GntR family transcriptional regulator